MFKNDQILKLTFIILTAFILTSCGGGGGGSSDDNTVTDNILVGNVGTLSYQPEDCTEEDEKAFIYKAMHDVYLWSSETPQLDYTAYSSQESLLNTLMYGTYDKWSYTITQQAYNDYYSGANIGLGIKMTVNSATNEIFISHVYPGSPADIAGLQRGYSITSVNGYSAEDMINGAYDEAFGPSTEGYEIVIDYINNSSTPASATIYKDDYYADSVAAYNIFTNGTNGKKIGYVSYLAFTSNYLADLNSAFQAFEDNGVEELIFDLRYNGGGQLSAARYIASQIGGNSNIASIMYAYIHNDKYSSWNRLSLFYGQAYDFDISKVVFLVTSSSASASETVINSLSPYMDVTLIGSTTHGKPVGMYAFSYCDRYLVPISFQTVNGEGNGDYFNGMSVDCGASDDIGHQLGDESEEMLSEAIMYLENGTCTNPRVITEEKLKPERRKGINRIFNMR